MFSSTNQPTNKKIRGIAATNKLPTPDADIYKALCLRWKRNKIPIEIASLHIAVELSKNFHSDQNHYIVMKDVISEDVDLRSFILSTIHDWFYVKAPVINKNTIQ